MKIEFNTEEELVSAILNSPANLLRFTVFLMEECGVTLSKTNIELIKSREVRTRTAREQLERWKEQGVTVYTETDIPEWIQKLMETTAPYPNIIYTIRDIVREIDPHAPMAKNYVKIKDKFYFNKEGLCFLIDRFCAKGYITHNDYEYWRKDSGFYGFLYNRDAKPKEKMFWEE